MAYGLYSLALLLLHLCLQCNLGTARPLPGQQYQFNLKTDSPPLFSNGTNMSAGYSDEDPTALPPPLLKNASSAFEDRTPKQTREKQDMDPVLTLPEASGHSAAGCGGILLDDLELSGECSGDGAWQDDADSSVTFSLTEPEEDSAPKPSTGIDDSQFSASGSEAFSSAVNAHPDDASQTDSPPQLFSSFGEVVFSGDSVWTVTDEDVVNPWFSPDDTMSSGDLGESVWIATSENVTEPLFIPDEAISSGDLVWDLTRDDEDDQPFSTSKISRAGESTLEQAMTVSQSVTVRSEVTDSNSGAGSQRDTEIVDIDTLPITAFSDEAKDEIMGSGEMEDEMYEDHSDTISYDFPDAKPEPQVKCSGECDSTVGTSSIDELTESLLLCVTTTTPPETQINPPASHSVIKVHKNSTKAGDNSSLDTDISDRNTSTGSEVTESNCEVIRGDEHPVNFVTKFLGSINDDTVNVDMTTEGGSTELVDLPPVNNSGTTLVNTHNVPAEGNNTVLP